MTFLPVWEFPINQESKQFWDAAAQNVLLLPRCSDCGFTIFYPRSICPECRSRNLSWIPMSGKGEVYSYTVTRRTSGRFKSHVPFVIAYVQLDEGPRMLTNVVDCDPNNVSIGMRVEVMFESQDEGKAIPRFKPSQ